MAIRHELPIGGESLQWLRLFPALAAIAALVPFLLLARGLRLGAQETTLALLLAAANGYLVKYAQELRMYSLLLLFTLTSLWLFVRLLNSARAPRALLFALFFVNLLLVYTHYYGWLVVACEAALLAYSDRRKLRALAEQARQGARTVLRALPRQPASRLHALLRLARRRVRGRPPRA